MIPTQLRKEKFILVDSNKRPIEKEWTTKNNYTYTEIQKILNGNKTYGVLTGNNNLLVLDCDDKSVQDKLITYPELMDTFITQTANKKLYHFYFHVTNVPKKSKDPQRNNQPRGLTVDNKDGQRILDVQGAGRQVVGPGSTLPDGRKYEIVSNKEISSIDYQFLLTIINGLDEQGTVLEADIKKKINKEQIDFDEVCVAIKQNIKPADILVEHFGTDTAKFDNPGMCPLGHGSQGGKCFHHTNDVWHCFHCGEKGNVIQLYQKIHKIEFHEAKKLLAQKIGLNDDLKKYFHQLYKNSKTRGEASDVLAAEIKKIYHVNTVRTDRDPEVWVYKHGIYIPEGKTYIEQFCRGIMEHKYNAAFVKSVIDKIKAMTYINEDKFFINEDVNLVPLENGILNLSTHELLDFDSKYKFFFKHPIVYDPLASCDKFIQFVRDILPDESDIMVVQELFGYLLYRDYKLRKAFLFTGKGGNGKSKLIEAMQRFVGILQCSSISLQSLSNDKFSVSHLFNKCANMAPDISSKELDDTSTFKAVTGHDRLTCDRKFRSPIEFTSFAKQIFACNEVPDSKDDTDSFYERWIILDFPYTFLDNPNQNNPLEKLRDLDIIEKVTLSGERMGMLNWALKGYERLMKNGKFTYNESTDNVRQIMKRKSNSFSAFIFDEIELDTTDAHMIPVSVLEKAYSRYCLQHKLTKRETKISVKNSKLENFGGYKLIKKINGKSTWVWKGIKLKYPNEEKFNPEEE
jgi:P4 family phage/plasmid primase-like protien